MFYRLTALEKSRLYGAIAELESKYGREAVSEGMEAMSRVLDKPRMAPLQKEPEQLALPFETGPDPEITSEIEKRRNFYGRNTKGANDKAIESFAERYIKQFPLYDDARELLVKLYYVDGLNQYQIADMAKVNQRAISSYLSRISEKRKQQTINKWKAGKANGY